MLVTLAESNTYFAGRPFSNDWIALSDTDKTKFLTMASNKIERLPFMGQKEDSSQTTLFPRVVKAKQGLNYTTLTWANSDYAVISDTPDEVKWAVFEEAFAIFEYMNDERYRLRESGVSGASRGGLSESYERYNPIGNLLSALATQYLNNWLDSTGTL
jgi:hypothetical protein